jgi:hypothetical protein
VLQAALLVAMVRARIALVLLVAVTVNVVLPFLSVRVHVTFRFPPEPLALQVPDFLVAPVPTREYVLAPVTGLKVAVSFLALSFQVILIFG